MPATHLVRAAGARVLVAHVNAAVGAALARRLMDADVVALARAPQALNLIGRSLEPDVVVLCPYLAGEERTALLAASAALPRPAAVVEMADDAGPRGAHLRLLAGCAAAAPVHSVLRDLALPLTA